MALLGIDPLRYLNTTDDLERDMLIEIHNRAIRIDEIRRHNLAAEIAREVSKLFGK